MATLGCATPDAPRSLGEVLPSGALSFLQPDTLRTIRLDQGVVYRYAWSERGPWAVHLLQADLGGRCDLDLDVLRAEPREQGGSGRERVSSMVARSLDRVFVAVNADFFTPDGDAVGTEVVAGIVSSISGRPAISWSVGRPPWIGSPARDGDSIYLGWPVSIAGGDGLTEAVGGFPELLDTGARVGDLEVDARPSFAAARHPRTALGYEPDTGHLWFVVVDGRQLPHSDGMTLPELTELFESLGVTEAINLDGGGSSAMIVDGVTVNRPSDPTGERPVVNALALVQDPTGCSVIRPR